jgi:parallel beta-helix repeat protein
LLNAGGDITIQSSRFLGNTSAGSGGGLELLAQASANLTGNTLANNVATQDGGGLYLEGAGRFTVTGGSVTGNVVGQQGGGIFIGLMDAGVIHPNVLITGNAAVGYGGGVAHAQGSTGSVTMNVSAVTGNLGDNNPQANYANTYGLFANFG